MVIWSNIKWETFFYINLTFEGNVSLYLIFFGTFSANNTQKGWTQTRTTRAEPVQF